MATWHLYVRDANLARQGEIDDYQRLEVTARYNAVGAWQLELDRRQRHAAALTEPGAGIVLTRDDAVVFSGPATQWQHTVGASQRLAVSGVDDMVWLRRRGAAPVPTAAAPPYSAQAYDVSTGTCSTVLRYYVNANLGPSATSARRHLAVTIGADPAIGGTVTGRARWQPLLTLLQELATVGEVGFRLVQVDDALEFQVFGPVDRTASVRFGLDLGNLAGFEYEVTAPEATYVFVGGGGEGTARTIYERADPTQTIWGRIEGEFIDRRDTSVSTELDQAAGEALTEHGAQTTLSISPVDTPALTYGEQYDLGDRVTVIIDDAEAVQDIVGQVVITLSAQDGHTVTPGIGTAHDPLRLFEAFRDMRRRVTNLERR